MLRTLMLALGSVLLLAACGGDAVPTLDDLAGSWTLVAVGGEEVTAAKPPTLTVTTAGEVSGHAGVNRYSGRIDLSAPAPLGGPMAVTRMAGPPEQMALEQAFLQGLAGARTFTIDGDRLTARDEDGAVVWVMKRTPA